MLKTIEDTRVNHISDVIPTSFTRNNDSARTVAPAKRVALLINSSGAYGRGILAGIAKYNRQHTNWSIFFRPRGTKEALPEWIGKWRGDGIITCVDTAESEAMLRRNKIPAVNLRGTLTKSSVPFIGPDNKAIAALAAEHLLERGLKHFGFVGKRAGVNPNLDQRGNAFRHLLEERGLVCHFFHPEDFEQQGWDTEQHELTEWIKSLPKPVGIMACNDERGLQVVDACRRANLVVPDDVAVIGADNDVCLCELSIPPLSSVDVNAEMIGFRAAAMLDKLMSGKTPSAEELSSRVAPKAVVTRRSTDVVAAEDEEVSRAISYIRANAFRRIHAADVLKHLGVSRTSLQQRMKALTGRTIHQEVQYVRLKKAQELLATSGITIKRVARESGFASVQYMTRVFHAVIGETPARYRNHRQVNGSSVG